MIRSLSAFLISAIFLSAACGGGTETETLNTSSSNRSTSPSNSVKPSEPAAEANNAEPVNSSAVNANSSPRAKRSDALRQAAIDQPRQPIDIEAVLKQSARPAPEDSEFAVALTDIVVERRTFKRHPVLAKVEKVTEGESSTIYVFTKDGSRKELPGARIPSISTAPSSTILQAVGLSQERPSVSDSKPRATEKN